MNKCIQIVMVLLITGCANRHLSNDQSDKFVEYKNPNKIGKSYGGNEIIKDRPFTLQIPKGLQNGNITDVGYSFVQILSFKDSQKIALIYTPDRKTSSSIRSLNITYSDFSALCKKEDIELELKDIPIDESKRFGMYKPNKDRFYVLYLNVTQADVNEFNYSVNSIQF